MAASHDAGLPMRIAVAMVSGEVTGEPCTNGAAPAAWNPHRRGQESLTPSALYSV